MLDKLNSLVDGLNVSLKDGDTMLFCSGSISIGYDRYMSRILHAISRE